MKFSTQEVMDLPIGDVFTMLTAFDQFERAAMRRGADIRRVDNPLQPGVGAQWFARIEVRGRSREIDLKVVQCQRPHHLTLEFTSQGMRGESGVDLIALSQSRTRLVVGLEMRPLTLSARLLLQSLKLTKPTLTRKYKQRIAQMIREMAERHRRGA